MPTPTREEFNARLEAFAILSHADVERLEAADREQREQLIALRHDVREINAKFYDLKITIVVTAATATLAILLGVGAINATIMSNMLASFEKGSGVGLVQQGFKHQLDANSIDIGGLKKDTTALRAETNGLKVETTALRTETNALKTETAALRNEMRAGFAAIGVELKAIREAQQSSR